MKTLAIECATEACSIALFDGDALIASDHRVLGRGHAEHLVPMIAALPGKGVAERILVSRGPGSFTGVRIGIAVAGALSIAWKARVAGYPTLSLVAAMALDGHKGDTVTVCMAGGHGEWFVQDFGTGGLPAGALASMTPAEAGARGALPVIAGSRASDLEMLLGRVAVAPTTLPDARHVQLLSPALLTDSVAPIYGRGPDARLPS